MDNTRWFYSLTSFLTFFLDVLFCQVLFKVQHHSLYPPGYNENLFWSLPTDKPPFSPSFIYFICSPSFDKVQTIVCDQFCKRQCMSELKSSQQNLLQYIWWPDRVCCCQIFRHSQNAILPTFFYPCTAAPRTKLMIWKKSLFSPYKPD